MNKVAFLILILQLFFLCSCQKNKGEAVQAMTLDEFTEIYNNYISDWLKDEILKSEAELEVSDQKKAIQKNLDKLRFRQSLGNYLNTATMEDLPKDLKWEDGLDQPEFADPKAKRGGVHNIAIGEFPPTFRWFGSNANHGFRGALFDDVNIRLVDLNPITGELIPGLAKKWAVSKDGRTVYFELHHDILYTDGSKLDSRDFHRTVFVMASDYVTAPYYKQFFREEFAQITTYSANFISVTLPEAKPLAPWKIADELFPAPNEFYSEYGPDFETRYQWRAIPHTGAYRILPGDFVKGASLKQARVKDWWGDDKKFYRNRYNPDYLNYTVIRDSSKIFELFKVGKIDLYGITVPEYYYEKSEIPAVFNGYVEKTTFYHNYVQIPRGFFMNMSKEKLKNRDFRLGLHHSINWEKVINLVHRGDFARLQQFYQGYGELTNPNIKVRTFSIEKARDHFAKAGYINEKSNGFLENENGKELSIILTYTEVPYLTKMFKILKEEAKKTGLNLLLDAQEGGVAFKMSLEKKHEMSFSGWGVTPPFPYYYQFFHSDNAYDREGNPKLYTNNINCFSHPRMDELAENARSAQSIEVLKEISMEAQQLIHDEAIFIPAYGLDFYRIAYWRWMKWPNTEQTQFSTPLKDTPTELFTYWIDDDVKKETLEAKRNGKTFPERVNIYDQYRQKGDKK